MGNTYDIQSIFVDFPELHKPVKTISFVMNSIKFFPIFSFYL